MDKEGILWVLDQIKPRKVFSRGSKNIQICCPLAKWKSGHKSENDGTPSMGIKISANEASVVNCFACKFGGTLSQLIIELNMRSEEDYRWLINRVDEMEEIDPEYVVSTIDDYDEPLFRYQEKVIDESEIANMVNRTHKYLLSRGLTVETLKEWGIGYDASQERVVFPVRRGDGALVGMIGRAIRDNQEPRHFNYFEFDKGHYLYGEDRVRGSSLVVAEGILDALSLWQEVKNQDLLDRYSVASPFGSAVTKEQAKKMISLAEEVILFFDDDPGGWTGQEQLSRLIGKKTVVRAVRYDTIVGEDPSSLINKGVDVISMIEGANLVIS